MCEGSILDSDLQMMSLYSDQRMHTGELSTQHQGFKPDLIIVLKTSRQFEITPGVPCTDEQYLSFTIPANHALRKTFKSVQLLRMPGVSFYLRVRPFIRLLIQLYECCSAWGERAGAPPD